MKELSKAQSAIEYLLFLGFIILVLIFIVNKPDASYKQGVEDYINGTKDAAINMLDEAMD